METYHGHVRTPADAIILFEACRLGLLPRVQRRLSEKERQSIKSGSVFVWDEREAGMRRWTDGKSWSASRVSGSFLTYREMEGKRGGGHASSRAGKTPESNRGSDEDQGEGGEEGPDGYRYKPDGLMKQSFSITTSTGQHLHLISYYARSHPNAPGLNQPSTDPQLRQIRPQKGLYPESSVNDQQNLPVVTRGPMGGAALAVPPPLAYGRAPPHHPYASSPYAWSPPLLGTPHVSVIPYVPNYLPPLGANGHPPFPYGHHPAYPAPPHGYPSPYDRYIHPAEHGGIPTPLHTNGAPMAAHGIPYYAQGHASILPHHDMINAHRNSHPATPPAETDPRFGGSRAEHSKNLRNGSQSSQPPLEPAGSPVNGSRKTSEQTSAANIVPSINALVNSVQAPLPPTTAAPSNSDHPKTIGQHQNEFSTPTKAANGAVDGPKDIPSDKIGFGEDMRALRQLDRVFSA
ncbi:cAMP-independent regulatory protein pac2 [Uncinocarpus reesii 1704]|uniref:cAMP-independent regulatory protein pac2 n=1 Tax=Uncinocarpus reesii (strain UAMH 1704) TaxID=336963 RepID=C4JWB2_UNCRE|nr:cAMP-independent regulatory protein pac2 [Uncinocarpus reesii 1704]EEP81989.1 cAMP-independent regulatory protein pac2 [Uncinocarpus reesii 1704]